MELLELKYRKPENILDLVYREIDEEGTQRASRITRILHRHGFTQEQVMEACKVMAARGWVEWLHAPDNERYPMDPVWTVTGRYGR